MQSVVIYIYLFIYLNSLTYKLKVIDTINKQTKNNLCLHNFSDFLQFLQFDQILKDLTKNLTHSLTNFLINCKKQI